MQHVWSLLSESRDIRIFVILCYDIGTFRSVDTRRRQSDLKLRGNFIDSLGVLFTTKLVAPNSKQLPIFEQWPKAK